MGFNLTNLLIELILTPNLILPLKKKLQI